ncbi:MAG: hypothetical protein KAQ93_05795 [Spirochaetales bacterium]|nr:hypothetical protein [Spirochaetales bacterium]
MDFSDYNSLENNMYQVMDKDGNLTKSEWDNKLNDSKAKTAYHKMLFARQADLKAVSFQRQGRMYTYPPNLGQEAIAVAAGMVIGHEDWLVPAFRVSGTKVQVKDKDGRCSSISLFCYPNEFKTILEHDWGDSGARLDEVQNFAVKEDPVSLRLRAMKLFMLEINLFLENRKKEKGFIPIHIWIRSPE